jgi:hypothetical protein
VALLAAAVFFAGSLFGSAGGATDGRSPEPVVVGTADRQPSGTGPDPGENANSPLPPDLDVQEVGHEVEEGEVEDYDDHGENEGPDDNSGPGSENSGPGSVSSGSGSDDSGSGSDDSGGDDNAGPGSLSSGSGSGSSGSGSSGSGSSGSGSDGSESDR